MKVTRLTVTSSRASIVAPAMFYQFVREHTDNIFPDETFFLTVLDENRDTLKAWTKTLTPEQEPGRDVWSVQLFYLEQLTSLADISEEYLFRCSRLRKGDTMPFELTVQCDDNGLIDEITLQFGVNGNSGWIGGIINDFKENLKQYGIPFVNVAIRIEGLRSSTGNVKNIKDTNLGAVYYERGQLWHQQESR